MYYFVNNTDVTKETSRSEHKTQFYFFIRNKGTELSKKLFNYVWDQTMATKQQCKNMNYSAGEKDLKLRVRVIYISLPRRTISSVFVRHTRVIAARLH